MHKWPIIPLTKCEPFETPRSIITNLRVSWVSHTKFAGSLRRDDVLDFGSTEQIFRSRRVVVHPALAVTQRLVLGTLQEVDSDISSSQLQRDTQSRGRLLGVPVVNAPSESIFMSVRLTSNACPPSQRPLAGCRASIQIRRTDSVAMG